MKKIIFIGICILVFCLNHTNLQAQKMTANKSSATFGRYGDCSTGRGICGIEADNLNAKSTTAKFSIERENDSTLILKIYHNKIDVKDEACLLGKPSADFAKAEQIYFKMDVDLPLDASTKLNLQTGKYSKILNGIYPITKFDSYYRIELKLN